MLGEAAYYEEYIAKSIDEFIQRRFEGIVLQYFKRKVRSFEIRDVLNIGSYWYDIPSERKNGQFDVVLQRKDGYDIFGCKFYDHEMELEECKKEEEQVNNIKELDGIRLGFVNLNGFNFYDDQYELITGTDLFE